MTLVDRNWKLIVLMALSGALLTSCTAFLGLTERLMGLEEREVVVVDQEHRPIPNAGLFPAPVGLGPNSSDKTGHLRVYVLDPTRRFNVHAVGYSSAWFSFDQPSKLCVLKREVKTPRIVGDNHG